MSELDDRIRVLQHKRWTILRDLASLRWKEKNPEKVKAAQKRYHTKHAEELRRKAKIRWEKNKDKINARRRKHG